ncbi:hypothetical protein [Bradyrhizobium sp. RDM4]|uniref:nucleotide-binding protein n=1 Tax=Bradyrhizobium sp. RDM4 TaxID=3378765 RepID=UPI0038FC8715
MIPHVIIVGADKGGVGKTFIARALIDYFRKAGTDLRAIDTQIPAGILQRFYPDVTEIVDLSRSDGQMHVFDSLRHKVTIVDCQAGSLSPTLKTLAEIGFLDQLKTGRLKITILHILGSTQASFDEIRAIGAIAEGAKHYLVTNHINGASFLGLSSEARNVATGTIDIAKLDELAAEFVDKAGVSFAAFVANDVNSAVMRGYIASWEKRVFAAFDAARLGDL